MKGTQLSLVYNEYKLNVKVSIDIKDTRYEWNLFIKIQELFRYKSKVSLISIRVKKTVIGLIIKYANVLHTAK